MRALQIGKDSSSDSTALIFTNRFIVWWSIHAEPCCVNVRGPSSHNFQSCAAWALQRHDIWKSLWNSDPACTYDFFHVGVPHSKLEMRLAMAIFECSTLSPNSEQIEITKSKWDQPIDEASPGPVWPTNRFEQKHFGKDWGCWIWQSEVVTCLTGTCEVANLRWKLQFCQRLACEYLKSRPICLRTVRLHFFLVHRCSWRRGLHLASSWTDWQHCDHGWSWYFTRRGITEIAENSQTGWTAVLAQWSLQNCKTELKPCATTHPDGKWWIRPKKWQHLTLG